MYWGFRAPADRTVQEELCRTLVPAGFGWMEVDSPLQPDPDYARHLRTLAARWDLALSIHCHFVDVNLSSAHPLVRERALEILRQDIAFAAEAGARVAVVHPGDIGWFDFLPPDHPCYREAQEVIDRLAALHVEAAAAALADLGAFAAGRGVRLVFENMYNPWDILYRPGDIAAFLARYGLPRVDVLLDVGHARVAGHAPAEFVTALGPRIGHVHVHWNDGRYDLHLPVPPEAAGELACLRDLVRQRPDVCLMVELPPRHPGEYLDSLAVLRAIVQA